jgi:hypothetical protein
MRGAYVVASEEHEHGCLVGSHCYFGDSPLDALARYRAQRRSREVLAEASSLGDAALAPGPLVWREIAPNASGDFAIAQGGRYAVLASVSRNYSIAAVLDYLKGHGWQVTYSWEQGAASRDTYAVDAWLQSLPPDPTDNHRWIYGEANRTGSSTTLSQDPPWPFTIYHVAHALHAEPAPATPAGGAAAPTLPAPGDIGAPAPSRAVPFLAGAALGFVGALLVRAVL